MKAIKTITVTTSTALRKYNLVDVNGSIIDVIQVRKLTPDLCNRLALAGLYIRYMS